MGVGWITPRSANNRTVPLGEGGLTNDTEGVGRGLLWGLHHPNYDCPSRLLRSVRLRLVWPLKGGAMGKGGGGEGRKRGGGSPLPHCQAQRRLFA